MVEVETPQVVREFYDLIDAGRFEEASTYVETGSQYQREIRDWEHGEGRKYGNTRRPNWGRLMKRVEFARWNAERAVASMSQSVNSFLKQHKT